MADKFNTLSGTQVNDKKPVSSANKASAKILKEMGFSKADQQSMPELKQDTFTSPRAQSKATLRRKKAVKKAFELGRRSEKKQQKLRSIRMKPGRIALGLGVISFLADKGFKAGKHIYQGIVNSETDKDITIDNTRFTKPKLKKPTLKKPLIVDRLLNNNKFKTLNN